MNNIKKVIVEIQYKNNYGTGIIMSLDNSTYDIIFTDYHVIDNFDGNNNNIKINSVYLGEEFYIENVLYDRSDVIDLDVAVIFVKKIKWFSINDNFNIPENMIERLMKNVKVAGFPVKIREENLNLDYLSFGVSIERCEEKLVHLNINNSINEPNISFFESTVGMSGGPLYCELDNRIYLLGIIKKMPVNEEGDSVYKIIECFNINWFFNTIEKLYNFKIDINKTRVNIDENFTEEWFVTRLDQNIACLGERYTEYLDIPRKEDEMLNYIYNDLKYNSYIYNFFENIKKYFQKINFTKRYDQVLTILNLFLNAFKEDKQEDIINLKSLEELRKKIEEVMIEYNNKSVVSIIKDIEKIANNNFDNDEFSKKQCIDKLEQIKNYISLTLNPFVLVKGKAGSGKSHFLAHCANKYMKKGGISVFVVGNYIKEGKSIILQIKDLLGIECSIDKFLNVLNLYGKINKKRSIIFLDGINESKYEEKEEILGFFSLIKKYKWIGIVISLRSKVEESLEEQLATKFNVNTIELNGLTNIKNIIHEYFIYYKVPLNLSNNLTNVINSPLLLKLYCKSYNIQDEKKNVYLKRIMNGYVHYINKNVMQKCNYCGRSNILKIVLNIFVDIIIKNNNNNKVKYDDFENQLNELKDIQINKSLLIDQLIKENIISEMTAYDDDDNQITLLYFEYELLEDYFITERILELANVAEFENRNQFIEFFSPKNRFFNIICSYTIMQMLLTLLPDITCKYEDGGFEVYRWPENIKDKFDEYYFYESLLLRNPSKINKLYVNSYITNSNSFLMYYHDRLYNLFSVIMKLCIDIYHCYNIKYLDEFFCQLNFRGFCREWVVFTSEEILNSDEFKNALYLAESQEKILNEEQKYLLGLTLSWCLISLDDKVKDLCEYYLYKIYREDIKGLTDIIVHFSNYYAVKRILILEKLMLIAMNCMYSSKDKEGKRIISNYLYNKFINTSYFKRIFFINEYTYYILEYAVNNNLIIKLDKCIFSYYDKDKYNYSLIEGEYSIKSKNIPEDCDWYLWDYILSNEYECEVDEYYTCNNDIIFNLLALCNNIDNKYNHIDTKTEEFIDIIEEKQRSKFCDDVIKTIFLLGYNYMIHGFYDLYEWKEKYIVQIYEKIAFDFVIMAYIKMFNNIERSAYLNLNDNKRYSGLWELPNYEKFDFSAVEYQFSSTYTDRKILSYKEVIKMIKNDSYVRIDNNGCSVYIIKNPDSKFDLEELYKGACIEGIYFSELFLSEGFFKYFQLLENNRQCILSTYNYLWDYEPFSSFEILSPYLYNKMNLCISQNKLYYYFETQVVCKNVIKETGYDELYIDNSFLRDFLVKNEYSIMWIFNDESNKLTKEKNIIKYDGTKITMY